MSDSVQEGQLPTEAPTTEPPAGGRQGEGGLGAGIGVVARASRADKWVYGCCIKGTPGRRVESYH